VGKTTSTVGLGVGLASRGYRTVAIDFDVGLRNLDLIMGCERRVVFDLINVIQDDLPGVRAPSTRSSQNWLRHLVQDAAAMHSFIGRDLTWGSGILSPGLVTTFYMYPELTPIRVASRSDGHAGHEAPAPPRR